MAEDCCWANRCLSLGAQGGGAQTFALHISVRLALPWTLQIKTFFLHNCLVIGIQRQSKADPQADLTNYHSCFQSQLFGESSASLRLTVHEDIQ